jgi:hypothetical protein
MEGEAMEGASLESVGAPRALSHLNAEWVPIARDEGSYRCGGIVVGRIDGAWVIHDDLFVYARAASLALHPHTVHPGEWIALAEAFPARWERMDLFRFVCAGIQTSAPEAPIELSDVGVDVFLRMAFSRPVWFVDPKSGRVEHSGAKTARTDMRGRLGRRFCHLCGVSLSANNFWSQHVRCVHPEFRNEPRRLEPYSYCMHIK